MGKDTKGTLGDIHIPEVIKNYPKAVQAYIAGLTHPEATHQATITDLQRWWADMYGVPNAHIIEGSLGVIGPLSSHASDMSGVVSVDLCDVLRTSGEDYGRLFDVKSFEEIYTQWGWYNPHSEKGIGSDVLSPLVTGMMVLDGVQPVPEAAQIKEILLRMKQKGIIILANTSTLEGCEPSTIRFLKTYFDGCFDGILLPRNPYGTTTVTKGSILRDAIYLIHELQGQHLMFVAHIDDSPTHVNHVDAIAEELDIPFYHAVPRAPWNAHIPGVIHTDTPLAAFEHIERCIAS